MFVYAVIKADARYVNKEDMESKYVRVASGSLYAMKILLGITL